MAGTGYLDFSIGIQLIDEGKPGAVFQTPYASAGGGYSYGWSQIIKDLDGYDPDGIAIGLIVPKNPQWVAYDFQLGAQALDAGEQALKPTLSPTLVEVLKANGKEGTTQIVGDADQYDPDAFVIGLLAYPKAPVVGRVDFHLEVRVMDRDGTTNDYGPWQKTPPLSKGGGWTPQFAFDKDHYDPDFVELKFVIDGYWSK